MKYVVSFSGGAGSYIAAKRIVDEHGPDNVELVFTDTLIESPDLYKFLDQSSEKLGCELIRLSDGRDPFQVFIDDKFMGNTRLATCSIKLKSKVFKKYMDDNHPDPDNVALVMGFDWNEGHRVDKAIKNWEPYKVVAPLLEPPYLEKLDMIEEIRRDGIDVPELYKMGFTHNNCGGFCVKAGQAHFKRLLNNKPERYKWCEQKEQECYDAYPNLKPFLRVTVDKELNYMTLKQFREHLQNNGQCDLFDFGGCGCFSE